MDNNEISRKSAARFERKFPRRIFGGVCENGLWRRRYNVELYQKHKQVADGKDAISLINIRRFKWAGHLIRTHKNNPPDESLYHNLEVVP